MSERESNGPLNDEPNDQQSPPPLWTNENGVPELLLSRIQEDQELQEWLNEAGLTNITIGHTSGDGSIVSVNAERKQLTEEILPPIRILSAIEGSMDVEEALAEVRWRIPSCIYNFKDRHDPPNTRDDPAINFLKHIPSPIEDTEDDPCPIRNSDGTRFFRLFESLEGQHPEKTTNFTLEHDVARQLFEMEKLGVNTAAVKAVPICIPTQQRTKKTYRSNWIRVWKRLQDAAQNTVRNIANSSHILGYALYNTDNGATWTALLYTFPKNAGYIPHNQVVYRKMQNRTESLRDAIGLEPELCNLPITVEQDVPKGMRGYYTIKLPTTPEGMLIHDPETTEKYLAELKQEAKEFGELAVHVNQASSFDERMKVTVSVPIDKWYDWSKRRDEDEDTTDGHWAFSSTDAIVDNDEDDDDEIIESNKKRIENLKRDLIQSLRAHAKSKASLLPSDQVYFTLGFPNEQFFTEIDEALASIEVCIDKEMFNGVNITPHTLEVEGLDQLVDAINKYYDPDRNKLTFYCDFKFDGDALQSVVLRTFVSKS